MLDHVAEQIGSDLTVISGFARRQSTRYEQLEIIKRRHGFRSLTRPARVELAAWLLERAIETTDGRLLLERLLAHMREQRIAAQAIQAADAKVVATVAGQLDDDTRARLDAVVDDKAHARQSRLSSLREPPARVGGDPLIEILDKLAWLRATSALGVQLDDTHRPRLVQMAREGVRLTAQAFQQMGAARRYTMLVATLRDLEATLTDAAIAMFGSLVGRANLRARKRLEETIALSADQGRERLIRIANVLEALTTAAKKGEDIAAAVAKVAALDVIQADAALIRRTTKPGRLDTLGELVPEYRVFKQVGARFLAAFAFGGSAASAPLRAGMAVLNDLGGDWRKPLPTKVLLGHIERRWHRHMIADGRVDRTYWDSRPISRSPRRWRRAKSGCPLPGFIARSTSCSRPLPR